MVNTAKTVALPQTGHSPTAEEMAPLESVHARIADEGGVTVVDFSIGTYEYVLERDMELAKDEGADCLARYLANMSDEQPVVLMAIEPLGQRASYLARALDTGLPSKLVGGQARERRGCTGQSSRATRRGGGTVGCRRVVPWHSADISTSPASTNTTFYESRRLRAAVDGSEANASRY